MSRCDLGDDRDRIVGRGAIDDHDLDVVGALLEEVLERRAYDAAAVSGGNAEGQANGSHRLHLSQALPLGAEEKDFHLRATHFVSTWALPSVHKAVTSCRETRPVRTAPKSARGPRVRPYQSTSTPATSIPGLVFSRNGHEAFLSTVRIRLVRPIAASHARPCRTELPCQRW